MRPLPRLAAICVLGAGLSVGLRGQSSNAELKLDAPGQDDHQLLGIAVRVRLVTGRTAWNHLDDERSAGGVVEGERAASDEGDEVGFKGCINTAPIFGRPTGTVLLENVTATMLLGAVVIVCSVAATVRREPG